MQAIKLKQIEDGDYQRLYSVNYRIGKSEHGGDDPDTLFFVRIEYTDEWGDSQEYKYHASIVTCGPGWPTPESLASCLSSMGTTPEEWETMGEEWQCRTLMDYGLSAVLWQEGGSNVNKLLKTARQKMVELRFLCGFALDRSQNAIGNSGWDFMRGTIGFRHSPTI